MIGFFPVPFPDEILYSVLARFHMRSRNKSLAATTKALFGHDASRIAVDLPNKLGYLVKELPEGSSFTIDRLIDETTLFPFYAPFIPPDRVIKLREDMIGKPLGGTIHGRLGILTSKIYVEFLRYCPVCAEEDFELYGELFWHRSHQLPGVLVCPNHYVFLENSKVKCSYHGRRDTLITARNEIKKTKLRRLNLDDKNHLAYLYLAQQSFWLLQQKNLTNCGPDFFRKRFIQILFKKNLASANGIIKITELESQFEKFYDSNFLSSLSCGLEFKHTWLKRLVQASKHFQHPIRNLLLLYFLQTPVENFVKLPEDIFPFGKPPYPCLNPASEHYGELRIPNYTLKKMYYKESEVLVIFKCDCGFTYKRIGCDEGKRFFEFDSIVSYGDVFIKKLLELKDKNFSPKQIALELNVSVNCAESLLKKFYGNNDSLSNIAIAFEERNKANLEKRDSYRSQWKRMRRLNPKMIRTELKKLNPTISNWLWANDKQWFDANSPARQVSRKRKIYVDWKKRDVFFSIKTENLALELLKNSGKPIRVTKTGLAKRLNFAYIVRKRPECIPKTIKTLEKYAESTEDFIARRIRFVAGCFIQERIQASYWQLIMRAGVIKPHLLHLPKVKAAINDSLNQIKNLSNSGW